MDSRLAQSYAVFAILMDSRSFPRRKSGIWEETDEKCCMERHVEQATIWECATSSHVLGFICIAYNG